MATDQLKYLLALRLVPKVGPKTAKGLIAYSGSAEAVFRQPKRHLEKIPNMGKRLANAVAAFNGWARVEQEMEFIAKHDVRPLSYLDPEYPQRLKDIESAPILLFMKGEINLNQPRVLAVVGTRRPSEYGKAAVEKVIQELQPFGALIVSGLAFGIDAKAHQEALQQGLETVGVFGHGLDQVYPWQHQSLAKQITGQGGLLTEYFSETKPDRMNFPSRNRIVAGISDGVLVVESKQEGGSLITAQICYSYNREVLAIPGRIGDERSSGCNMLIKQRKASMVENGEDIAQGLGWDLQASATAKPAWQEQPLSPHEEQLVGLLREREKLDIDTLAISSGLSMQDLSSLLLQMEFRGILRALPGKHYQLAV